MTSMKCTEYCMPSVKAPYKEYHKPCIRPGWSKKPGFWNPNVVADFCLSIIGRSVYTSVKTLHDERPTFDEPCGARTVNHRVCWGIRMYLEPWNDQDDIDKAVQNYIECPCKSKMEGVIDSRPEKALAFLVTYFKYRGPFITLTHRKSDWTNLTARHIGTTIMAYLRMLPEIEMCAAQQIGRYLSNLHRMASDLGYLNFRENLATVWGPIFLKVEPPAEPGRKPCTQSACDEYEAAVEIFAKAVDIVPWDAVGPAKVCSLPTTRVGYVENDYVTTNKAREECLMKHLNRASSCKGSLAEKLRDEALRVCATAKPLDPEEAKMKSPECCTEVKIPEAPICETLCKSKGEEDNLCPELK